MQFFWNECTRIHPWTINLQSFCFPQHHPYRARVESQSLFLLVQMQQQQQLQLTSDHPLIAKSVHFTRSQCAITCNQIAWIAGKPKQNVPFGDEMTVTRISCLDDSTCTASALALVKLMLVHGYDHFRVNLQEVMQQWFLIMRIDQVGGINITLSRKNNSN